MTRFGNVYHKDGDTKLPFQFIAADTTATAGATITPTSLVADVFPAEECTITMKATPAAASSSTITFYWVGRAHANAPWPTSADFFTTLTLQTAKGTDPQASNQIMDSIPYTEIKLLSIVNGDGTNALSAVNAYIGYKH